MDPILDTKTEKIYSRSTYSRKNLWFMSSFDARVITSHRGKKRRTRSKGQGKKKKKKRTSAKLDARLQFILLFREYTRM